MKSKGKARSTLRDIQDWMAGLILDPSQLHASEATLSPVTDVVSTPPKGTAATRVAVHTDGYPARVHEALLEAYPAIEHVVGEAPFIALVYRLLPQLPREAYNLNEIGQVLPAFLRADELGTELPFLPDLAELEWKIVEAFHAPMLPPFNLSRCADWDLDRWQKAVMSFQPSTFLISSGWPIREIWKARKRPVEEIDIELVDNPDRALVYRRGFEVKCDSLSGNEAEALEHLIAGESLGNTLEALAASQCRHEAVMNWFSRWMSLNLIVEIAS